MLNDFKNIIYWLVGALIFLFFFYFRVIRVRLPKDLRAFYVIDEMLVNNYFTGVNLPTILLTLTLLRLFFLFKEYYYPSEPGRLLKYIIEKLNPIIAFFKDSLYIFYITINDTFFSFVFKIFKVHNVYSVYEKLCFYLFYHYNAFDKYIIIFEVLPRTFLYSVFLIEIFVFFKLKLFYKIIWIMLIPLLFKFFIFNLNDFSCSNILNYEKRLVKKSFHVCTPEEYHITSLVDPENDPLSKNPLGLTQIVESYRNVLTFKEYFLRYSLTKKHLFDFWISLSFNLSLLIRWSYVIIYNYIMFIY